MPSFLCITTRLCCLNILRNGEIQEDILETQNSKLSYLQFNYLLQQGQLLLNNPALGLEFGTMLPLNSNGLIGMSVLASENISEAIAMGLRYKKSIAPITTLSLHHAKQYSYLQCLPAMDQSEFSKIYIEICFTSIYAGLKTFLPELREHIFFEFNYPQPSYHQEYVKKLNANVKFNCVKNRIILDSSLLTMSLPLANKQIITEAIQMMDGSQKNEKFGFIALIHRVLQNVEPQHASLEYLADKLCTSVSSLKRKLSIHYTNFQKISDTIRMDKSCSLLEQEQKSIAEIAQIIGFSDAASFRKAFKRWTGETPQDYRANVFKWIPVMDCNIRDVDQVR